MILFSHLQFVENLLQRISQETTAILMRLSNLEAVLKKGLQEVSATQSQLDQEIAALQAAVAQETTVDQSAIALVNGIPALIQTAVANALAAGATPTQLQAVTDALNTIQANSSALGNAVTANTPASPPSAPATA